MRATLIYLACAMFFCVSCLVPTRAETVVYKLTMKLYVPRVYDNTESLGYRKVQQQRITGYIYVDKDAPIPVPDGGDEEIDGDVEVIGPREPAISVCNIVNHTHRVQGRNVTYGDVEATDVMWRYIGSNKKGIFRKPQVKFSLDLDPSYNIGADEPDNALIITLSGRGFTEKSIKGGITGQIGCGCTAYGHISPTRTIDWLVNDITPLYGTFNMKRVKALCYK